MCACVFESESACVFESASASACERERKGERERESDKLPGKKENKATFFQSFEKAAAAVETF